MLQFIKNIFNRKNYLQDNLEVRIAEDAPSTPLSRRPLTITVHYAHGGLILSTNQYNKKEDEYELQNYIVHDDSEIAKTVEKIIFMDQLKR